MWLRALSRLLVHTERPGIGGGGFMTVRIPGDGVYSIDFRETAPDAANKTMFGKDPLSSLFGGLSVGVPGELRGLQEMHNRWGKLPWKTVVTPVAHLAKGWFIGPELARRLVLFKEFMESDPDWIPTFAPKGTILKQGEWISRANLSRTLYTIAEQGADAFYSGAIAESLVAKIRETGGVMTLEDFANYRVHVDKAMEGSYRGKKIFTTKAPTSGAVLIHILNLLEKYNLPEEGLTPLNLHRVVEALKFGFAARTRLGDPAFIDDHALIREIPTKEYAEHIAPNITDDTTHTFEYYKPVFDVPEDHGTMHLSVVDKDHMAVSVTSTVNLVFGSRVLDTNTGVILNDELDDFSRPGIPNYFGLWPSPYNYPEARKRPLSSTCPTIIENADGSLYAVLGGSGGSRIFPSVAQVIVGLDVGRTISEAVEGPRAHDQLFPAVLDLDSTFPAEHVAALQERRHNVSVTNINGIKAVVQGIMVDEDGVIWAAADSRKNGIAAGY
ncbi:gamma-glutamyltranspeptidase [Exidia glandulosa HHB12029]|uniref:Gamma-glutamyltranspeptidase n=1 Tax=Exidia glandulosa HHB12029 TaxID=1314781 RepID=A0A165JP85_EXIGL|nr:gamma-glutamyltranspeptidase [Exidia glandulosa HHB12029]